MSRVSLFIALNILILGLLFIGFGREYLRNRQIENEIAALEAERIRLEGEQLASVELIRDLSSEYYLEREAREKNGLGEPGEKLVIVDLGETEKPSGEVQGVIDDGISNPARWWYYIFDQGQFESLRTL